MTLHDDNPFTVLDPEFYVPFQRRKPGTQFRDVVTERLTPPEWTVHPGGIWTQINPRGWSGGQQGWKLHVSALPADAMEVLRRVAEVLAEDPTAFKFASDPRILDLILTKNWSREGGGKFITLYPTNEEQFRRLAAALSAVTAEFHGPYILSDRRVPGSRIVFYRYGEHVPAGGVDLRGNQVPRLVGPKGETASDRRTGYYQVPAWIDDPYGARPVGKVEAAGPRVVLRDRYEVLHPLKYSNVGGIYRAKDLQTEAAVVIRERRPFYGWVGRSLDSVGLLHKEASILRAMDGTGWTPRYVDAFQVWEHHYVAMEYVPGAMLRDFASASYLRRGKIASPRVLFRTFRKIILDLVRGVEEFHRRGIILRDLTTGNVLVRPDGSVCFIDLEFAWEREGDQPAASGIQTQGFASPQQAGGQMPVEGDDFYALGAVVVEMCSFMASGLGLNPGGVLASTERMLDEVDMPRVLVDVARGLLHPDPARRWRGAEVRHALAQVPLAGIAWTSREPGRNLSANPPPAAWRKEIEAEAEKVCDEVCEFLEASADPSGEDCLWPSSPQAFRTNAVSILFGACGPIEYVRRVRGSCSRSWLDWTQAHAVPERTPPGFALGLAGVARTLATCGENDAATRLVQAALGNPLLEESPDLYYGASGVGLAALEIHAATGDPSLLDSAVDLAAAVAKDARQGSRGLAWPTGEGKVNCGLATGSSGIALFLTYLGARTGEERYWALARRALAFDLSQAQNRGAYPHLPDAVGRHRSFWSPHVAFGTAGLVSAAVRLHACTGDPELLAQAERLATVLTFRWTNKLWQDMGYAGWGETLLDLHAVTGNPVYRDHALRMAESILPHRVQTRYGTAFPAYGMNRVASDFAMGTSGIALFLHRLTTSAHRAFFPDHLLPGWPRPEQTPVPATVRSRENGVRGRAAMAGAGAG